MKTRACLIGLSVALTVGLTACNTAHTVTADSMQFCAPGKWRQETPSHPDRSLQFVMPSRSPGFEAARLVVWNVSAGGTGRSDAAIARILSTWRHRIKADDGRSVSQDAMSTDLLINNMPVHVVDVSGRYTEPIADNPTAARGKPGFRMIAASIRAPQANYIVKLVGPAPVVADHLGEFERFLASVQPIDGMTPTAVVGATPNPRAQLTALGR